MVVDHGSVVGGVALVTGGTGAICSEVSAGLALAGMRVVLCALRLGGLRVRWHEHEMAWVVMAGRL